ncbi:MAG TPA: NrpR regulatory domain-containing protein [Syntrophorhabdaceae bacterium]|jgi:hypothetical protein
MHKKMFAILNLLNDGQKRMDSGEMAGKLGHLGIAMSDRRVRHYLKILDEAGFTEGNGRTGRTITARGKEELGRIFPFPGVGSLANSIDNLSFLTNVDPGTGKGKAILNVTLVPETKSGEVLELLDGLLNSAYGVSNRIVIRGPGETIGSLVVPEQRVAIGTVCSITLNGILLKAGVAVTSRFGGIVEIVENSPAGFLSVISYQGSSVAPLQIFMKSGMTDVLGALRSGMGRVLGSFREIPEVGLERAKKVVREMEKIGFHGRTIFGTPGRPLLGIPVSPDRVGMVVLGGLNPAAAVIEAGFAEETRAMATLCDYEEMDPIENPARRLSGFGEMGLLKSLHTLAETVRPDCWSVFEGLKQSSF